MEINNFYQLENLLEFKEGSYYKFIALIRAKDNSGVIDTKERGEIFVRQWFVDSQTSLLKYREDMINLCKATGARLYVTTDRKSVKKTVFKMLEQLQDIIKQFVFGSYSCVSLRKLSKFSSSASSLAECSDGPKYWLIDIDNTDGISNDIVDQLSQDFEYIFHDKKIIRFKTVNGWHLLIKRNFDYRTEFAKRWQLCKNGTKSDDPAKMTYYIQQEEVFERLWKYRSNYEDKENALTLVYFNKGE